MTSLAQQVTEQILQRIKAGELKVGDQLEPEVKLASELGVSRSTIRLAFTDLEKKGVLSRRRRSGTQVISTSPKKRFSMVTRNVQELLSLGRATHLKITHIGRVHTEQIPELQKHQAESEQWLEIIATRTLQGEQWPFVVNRVYVPEKFVAIVPILKSKPTSIFQVIEEEYNTEVARVRQTTRAMLCPAEEQTIMGLSVASPALLLEADLYAGDGSLIEMSKALYDAKRFEVESEVTID